MPNVWGITLGEAFISNYREKKGYRRQQPWLQMTGLSFDGKNVYLLAA